MNKLRTFSFLVPGFLAVMLLTPAPASAQNCAGLPDFPTGTVTATQDRDRMLCSMGISFGVHPPRVSDPNRPVNAIPPAANPETTNWRDPVNHTVTRGNFGQWITYDSPAGLLGGALSGFGDYGPFSSPRYTDIDLLKMKAGQAVTSREDWWTKRRPEIFSLIQQQFYGTPIPKFPITWAITGESTGTQMIDGVAVPYRQKTITGTVDKSSYPALRNTPIITAQCRFPAAFGRYPVIITYGEGTTRFQYLAQYGIGTCSYNPGALQPDNGNNGALSSYLIGLMNQGNWREPSDPGTLVAWGWGISRLIDYFETDPDIHPDKVGVEGHSRYGKATLVTAAYDPRVVVAWPSDAGAMGTAMARRSYGETLEQVAGSSQEYHWVNGGIFNYAGPLVPGGYMPRKAELLDVDAHSTTALIAPRAVFVTNGTDTPAGFGDAWADPRGCYLSGKLASPVWELLGWPGQVIPPGTIYTDTLPDWQIHESIGGTPMFNKAYTAGTVGWRRQIEGHTPVPNWPSFAAFAARYLNDERPQVLPYQFFVLGDHPADILGLLQARDPDPWDYIQDWQVKGGTGAYKFRVEPGSGVLRIGDASAIDFSQSSYSLVVMAGDGKLPSHDQTVTIMIPNQVNICYNGLTLSVPKFDVPNYLTAGGMIGTCSFGPR